MLTKIFQNFILEVTPSWLGAVNHQPFGHWVAPQHRALEELAFATPSFSPSAIAFPDSLPPFFAELARNESIINDSPTSHYDLTNPHHRTPKNQRISNRRILFRQDHRSTVSFNNIPSLLSMVTDK